MKDTNAIEKALLNKVNAELKEVVSSFIDSVKKLKGNKSQYFDLKDPSSYHNHKQQITCITLSAVETILFNMLKDNFSQNMLNKKSKELLAKLEIL